jgi:hypothetical protein
MQKGIGIIDVLIDWSNIKYLAPAASLVPVLLSVICVTGAVNLVTTPSGVPSG